MMIKSFEDYPDYFYSGFFIRLFAFTIDLIMIGAVQRMTLFYFTDGTLKTSLSLAIYLFYFILLTKFNHGQTLGKMIFGIKVICLKEEKLSWTTVIVREGFGRYLQKVLLILYTLTIFTRYKQHVVDLLSDTSVVTINYLRLLEKEQMNQPTFVNEALVAE